MAELLSQKLNDLAVTFADAVATLPVPSADPSAVQQAAFAKWESGRRTSKLATVSVDSDGTGSITGATLYGFDKSTSKWRSIGTLNATLTISLTAIVGFEELMSDVGIFVALAVAGTVVGGINVTVIFTPISSTE